MSAVDVRPARTEHEVDQGFDLADRTFPPGYSEARAHHERRRDLEGPIDPSDVILAKAGDSVVGFVWIIGRHMYLAGRVVPVGGISLVSVRADLRGRGIGLQLMESALARQRARADVLSILFARRAVDGWYPKVGYVGIGAHVETVAGRTTDLTAPADVGAFDSRAVPAYLRAYASSYGELFLSFRRDERWWGRAPDRYRVQAGSAVFRTVSDRAGPVGYFVTIGDRLIEIAAEPAHRPFVLAAWERSVNGDRLVGSLPLGHWATRELRRREHTTSVRFSWDGGHMVRALDASAFSALSGELDRDADLTDHGTARRMLLDLAGVGRSPRALWPEPPSWSPIDEL